MKITWIGQAGLLFDTGDKKILIDPYLSNSVAKIQPHNDRRVAVDKKYLDLKPDIILITHNHADHLDKATLKYYLNENTTVTVLAPNGSWQEVRKFGGLNNNYVLFNNATTWSCNYATFKAVKAEHSDEYAIGVIININNKNYYITGDTLYNEKVFKSLENIKIDTLFLPINGVGNNMNFLDAEKFSKRINAKYSIPYHYGMFDSLNPNEVNLKNKKILKIYEPITI